MKYFVFAFLLIFSSNQIQAQNLKKLSDSFPKSLSQLGNTDISKGIKEALTNGITKQVSQLTAVDGFYGNENVKIPLPAELKGVESTLRKLGMGNLADESIKSLNRAAENAVKEATPIFIAAIKKMSIKDAQGILLGTDDAATSYLKNSTSESLLIKFKPIIQQSIGKVGADKIWSNLITQYNSIPFINKINPDLEDYIAQKALEGVFKMIAVEEQNIRTDLNSRTSSLLKKVFSLQDVKK